MTRKRKALTTIDKNSLPKASPRRLESDDEFSLESWERRAMASSKTPKISNRGNLSSKNHSSNVTTRIATDRKPPKPTRRSRGSLGSSILGPPRRNLPTPPPSTEPIQSSPNHQLYVGQNSSPVSNVNQSSEKAIANAISKPFYATVPCLRGDGRRGDSMANASTPKANIKKFPELQEDSDEDMNCGSSGDSCFTSSSSSSKTNEEMEAIKMGRDADPLSEEKGPRDEGDGSPRILHKHVGRRTLTPFNRSKLSEKGQRKENADRSLTDGTVLNKKVFNLVMQSEPNFRQRDSEFLGKMVHTPRYTWQKPDEESDITSSVSSFRKESALKEQMTSDEETEDVQMKKNEGDWKSRLVKRVQVDKTPASFFEEDDEASLNSCSSKEGGSDSYDPAKNLFYNSRNPDDGDRRQKRGQDPTEDEIIEAWSINGHSVSPIEFKIRNKKYVHPPLPAGWKLKISKTHQRPIYIHPDIGRTYHCPVHLPPNMVYVRQKNGALEQHPKESVFVSSSKSPGIARTPKSPPYSPSDQSSPASPADSTSELIRGVSALSALCIRNSSMNLQRAEGVQNHFLNVEGRTDHANSFRGVRETPSNMSDLLRLYERKTN